MPELREVEMALIAEPALPIREAMDEDKLNNLAASMRAQGLIQPITLKPADSGFEIVAGHRRYLAARLNEWTVIRALIYQPEELNTDAAMLAENIFREDVTEAEEALWFTELITVRGWEFEALVKAVGQKEQYVNDRLALLAGDEAVFNALRERKINFSVARELNKIRQAEWIAYYLDLAIRLGMTARAIADARRQIGSNEAATQTGTPAPVANGDKPAVQICGPECVLCGGNKDPYNLEVVHVHKFCKERLEQIWRAATETA